jgi:hypothetical protein
MGGAILANLSRDPYVAVPALDGFFAVSGDPNTPEHPGPAGVEPTGPGIVIDAGGAGAHLYCHAGRWWVHGYH